ncbi:MAG: cell envelope integrity protein CreD [Candidatus Cloacimonadaceae bacterium]
MPDTPERPSYIPKTTSSFWKLILIGFLILVLMIPVFWIVTLVNERHNRSDSVMEEIASKWGAEQLISGPFISVPYYEAEELTDRDSTKRLKTVTRYLYLTPDSLNITGSVESTTHRRSFFEVPGYKANISLGCSIPMSIDADVLPQEVVPDWKNALLIFDVKDNRGLKELTGIINGQPLIFRQSYNVLKLSQIYQPDIESSENQRRLKYKYHSDNNELFFKYEAKIPIQPQEPTKISLNLTLTGTQQLSFLASALKETINLSGDWPSPSFNGDILPDSREVTSQGFTSRWQTSYLNTGNKAYWTSKELNLHYSVLGVSFLMTVNSYQQSTRTLKYSILFLLLTFMTFYFAEITSRQRIHPIQYLMVGCSLIIFYLLLLSLSEHLGFGWSYLIAAAGVILQITLYCYTILRTRKFAVQTGGMLTALYVFLYILLQLEDIALLVGSISLFAMLGVAMYAVRNVKWYNQE